MDRRRQLEQNRVREAVTAVQSLHLQNICLHIRMIQSRSQHAFHTLPVKQPERNCRCDGYQCSKHRNFYPIFLIFFQNTVPCHFLIHSAISHDPAQLRAFPMIRHSSGIPHNPAQLRAFPMFRHSYGHFPCSGTATGIFRSYFSFV